MRRAAKIDNNQTEIVDELRAAGYSVQSLAAIGKGCPDLAVAKLGITILVEVKDVNGKLNEQQKAFFQSWKGICIVARSAQDVLDYFHGGV